MVGISKVLINLILIYCEYYYKIIITKKGNDVYSITFCDYGYICVIDLLNDHSNFQNIEKNNTKNKICTFTGECSPHNITQLEETTKFNEIRGISFDTISELHNYQYSSHAKFCMCQNVFYDECPFIIPKYNLGCVSQTNLEKKNECCIITECVKNVLFVKYISVPEQTFGNFLAVIKTLTDDLTSKKNKK